MSNTYADKSKHNPPAVKEWFDSIYTFNKSRMKILPSSNKNVFRLIKGYFNLYSKKLDIGRAKSSRMHRRKIRLSTTRLLVSKPELKHTSDRINVTVYTYDGRKKYNINKLNWKRNLNWLLMHNEFDEITKEKMSVNKIQFALFLSKFKNEGTQVQADVQNYAKGLLKKVSLNNHMSLLKRIGKAYIKSYAKKLLQKEVVSMRYRKCLFFEKSKCERQHLFTLVGLLERIYNKKVTFNIVNLKYIYNSSGIFSQALLAKLTNKANKPIRVLKNSLQKFEAGRADRLSVYNQMYNKKKLIQNAGINNVVLGNYNTTYNHLYRNDIMESLLKFGNSENSPSVKDPAVNLNEIVESLKHKSASGVRIEIAGRLTKRNTAARSMSKFRHKGNINNPDSSFKGLSTVLLRGHAKSNLMYNQLKSKLRIGSFGLKTWVSTS